MAHGSPAWGRGRCYRRRMLPSLIRTARPTRVPLSIPGMSIPFIGAVALLLGACGGAASGSSTAPTAAPPRRAASGDPKLVVMVVIDQLSAETLAKYLPVLPENGVFRTAGREGAVHAVACPYAGTYTAPGHATLGTGTFPAMHGITSNKVVDGATRKSVDSIADVAAPVFGAKGEFASPRALLRPTVSDSLREHTRGLAKVVTMSLKDRGAVLVGGHNPTGAYWYEDSLPGFTTSSYYAKELATWVTVWDMTHPTESYLAPWTPENPELLQKTLGADDQPGEGGSYDLDSTFPHAAELAKKPLDTFRLMPGSVNYLLDFAKAAFEQEKLCSDDVPDLLGVSVSTTDYVGHTFGPDSWEYLDTLTRTDRALGEFSRWIEERCPNVAFVLSADHGHAALVEHSSAHGHPAQRVGSELARSLDEAVSKKLGGAPGDKAPVWIEAYVKPMLHFTEAGRARRAEVSAIVIDTLKKWPSVYGVYDPSTAAALRASKDPVERAVGLSIHDGGTGELFVVPAPYNVFDEGGKHNTGTSHGTPWDYDQVVPGLAWGTGVVPSKDGAPMSIRRIAATVAALLGVPAPNDNDEPPLPGVTRPALPPAKANAGAIPHECPCKKTAAATK